MSPEEGDTTQKEKASNFQPQFLRGPLDVSCPRRQVCCLFLVETSRISYRLMVQKSLLFPTTWDGARTGRKWWGIRTTFASTGEWVERRISGCHQRYQASAKAPLWAPSSLMVEKNCWYHEGPRSTLQEPEVASNFPPKNTYGFVIIWNQPKPSWWVFFPHPSEKNIAQ